MSSGSGKAPGCINLALTLAFYALILACLISFLGYRVEFPRLFVYLGIAAIVVRIIHYLKRLL